MLRELHRNLIPYPALNFLKPSLVFKDNFTESDSGLKLRLAGHFEDEHSLTSHSYSKGMFVSSSLKIPQPYLLNTIRMIDEIRGLSRLRMVDWMPCAFKIHCIPPLSKLSSNYH